MLQPAWQHVFNVCDLCEDRLAQPEPGSAEGEEAHAFAPFMHVAYAHGRPHAAPYRYVARPKQTFRVRALLTLQVNTGSLYRCGKRT